MFVIIILLLIGLCVFMVYSADDLLNKTSNSKLAWGIGIFIFLAFVGCLFILTDEVKRQTVIDFHKGKYQLEMVTHSDTTYLIKKVK